jgi:cobalt-zinc-cadmium efflux system membrane fusion protein
MISTTTATTTTRRTPCLLAIAIMLTLTACSKGDRERPGQMTSFSTTGSKSGTPQLYTLPADQMSHIQLVTVQPSTLTHTLRLTGAVAYNAFKTTPVITQVGGPVSRVLAVPGQQVRAGQPMLEISSPDYSQLLDSYLKAADSSRLADKNYARAKDLYEHHANALRDLEQAESDRNQAQADLNAAEQGMKILGIKNPADLAKAPSSAQIQVLAPLSGEVVERLVSPGQVVQAGQTQAFTISDLSTVWVLANVYQADLASIHDGDDVVVTTDAYPGSFHGKISYVSPSLDANTRTLQARIVVDNPGEKLKKDMYCTVSVTAGSISRAVAMPDSSILRDDNNQTFVYVTIGDNQFGRRDVEIGPSQNGQTQILKGISIGERVVGDGSLFLQFANSLQH